MKTPDEIKMGLRFAETNCLYVECCEDICPYNKNCDVSDPDRMAEMPRIIATDALAYIQQLEAERDALNALYKPHSTCGSCKHYYKESTLCDGCTNKNNCWEWAGIKEVTHD